MRLLFLLFMVLLLILISGCVGVRESRFSQDLTPGETIISYSEHSVLSKYHDNDTNVTCYVHFTTASGIYSSSIDCIPDKEMN